MCRHIGDCAFVRTNAGLVMRLWALRSWETSLACRAPDLRPCLEPRPGCSSKAAQLGSALLGPQDLERITRLIDLTVQDAVPSKAEDVVNSIEFAPRHSLRTTIVGIAPEGDAGLRPVLPDAPDQMLEHQRHPLFPMASCPPSETPRPACRWTRHRCGSAEGSGSRSGR